MGLNSGGTRLAALAVGLVLFGTAFAACGGDGGSDAPSKDDFIAQADQICADYTASADAKDAEFQATIDSGDFDGAADLFIETTDEITTSLDEIEAIGIPEGDEETIDEWISLGREQVVIAGEIAESIRAEDAPAIQAGLKEGEALQKEADAIADDYGMIDCGSAGNDS
jgi:hypothetical protein